MRRPLFAALSIVVLAALPTDGRADAAPTEAFHLRTAQDLLDICSVQPGDTDYDASMGFCLGFIEGGGHYHDSITSGPERARLICQPEGVTRQKAIGVFVSYLGTNPQHLADPPMEALVRAAMNEWPCATPAQ